MNESKTLKEYVQEGLQSFGYTRERLCRDFSLSEPVLDQFLDNSAVCTRAEIIKLAFVMGTCVGFSGELMLTILGIQFDPSDFIIPNEEQKEAVGEGQPESDDEQFVNQDPPSQNSLEEYGEEIYRLLQGEAEVEGEPESGEQANQDEPSPDEQTGQG